MNIQEAKDEIIHTLKAYHRKNSRGDYVYPVVRQRPILLIGPPGIGKTAIMEQIAEECGVGLVAYTITHHTRQSAVGLPKIVTRTFDGTEMTVTEYTMSEMIASVYECMERTGKREGILFIDEINCVSETLAPTMLQFLQNKTFGTHKVPEGWIIVAAGNPPEYNKSVREFDIVTLDRVRRIRITEDCDVWLSYGWKKNIHGAILSYLNLKKDHFYVMENTPDGKFFVTARGWEDLSELLKSYELLDVKITEELVLEFLQKREIARDFTAYYMLYQKYQTDYGVPELLEGTLTDAEYRDKLSMAQGGGFEERFVVTELFLDGLTLEAERYWHCEELVQGIYEHLLRIRERLEKSQKPEEMKYYLRIQRESLQAGIEADLFSNPEIEKREQLLEILESYDLEMRKLHLGESQAWISYLRECFQKQTEGRKSAEEHMKRSLENSFVFLEQSFGNGQEMAMFMTRLTACEKICRFVSTFGCREYIRHSEILMYRSQERKLMEECKRELADSQEEA